MNVGFIGLGIMGRPMATNLLKAGFALVVYDKFAKFDDLIALGAKAGASNRDVAARSEVIITMLPNSPHVREAVLGACLLYTSQASRLQKEKAQQFATIIDFVHDGIVAIDRSGRITVFNSASEKITGYNKHKALGKKITEVIPETKLLNILETEQSEIGDIQRLDDHTVIASNRVPVIVDGEVLGAVATYQDITEVQKLEQKIRIRLSEKGFVAQYSFDGIIHESVAISDCIRTAKKFAMYDTSVLICGPSGVGKELFAQGIHNCSPRRNSPFVAINCAALPESLIESELFGYVEGSFTGATKKGKAGLFEMAHGGTILLDEISELPLLLQGRLLRVLQEKQVMRIGDNKLIPVDVRIICATNRDLRSLVSQNLFRVDLYLDVYKRQAYTGLSSGSYRSGLSTPSLRLSSTT